MDVLWRIGMGVLLGFGTGKILARLFFSARHDSMRLSNHSERGSFPWQQHSWPME